MVHIFGMSLMAGLFFFLNPVRAVEMDELMDNVLDSVREETRQTIQQEVKQETREVIAEEQVIPSSSRTGNYRGTGGQGEPVSCDFTFTDSKFSGQCRDQEGDIFALSGTVGGNSFTLTIKEIFTVDGFCPAGTETNTGSGAIQGEGAPGTNIIFTVGPTCGDSNSTTVNLVKA